jgi:hypothetical protein
MGTFFLNLFLTFIKTTTAKKLVELGLKKLVKSTDNGIDNVLLDVMLDEAVKSKLNDLTEKHVEDLKAKIKPKNE